jgi:hypothetical protein
MRIGTHCSSDSDLLDGCPCESSQILIEDQVFWVLGEQVTIDEYLP